MTKTNKKTLKTSIQSIETTFELQVNKIVIDEIF